MKIIKEIMPEGLKRRIRLMLHSGNVYECPFCNYLSKDLAPVGFDNDVLISKQVIGGGKRFGSCYKCGSSDRERLIYIYLLNEFQVFDKGKELKILHIAPEVNISKRLNDFGFTGYICGDLFAEGYLYPAHVKNINIQNIPYEDETFDLIICNHVLEHIPDDRAAMKEINRVLKTKGEAVLQVPISNNSGRTFEDFSITDPRQREISFGQFDHVRIYGQDYVERLRGSGFAVERINLFERFKKYGLNENEDIFIGSK